MSWEKILLWIGSGAIITLLGRTFLLWTDSRYITRSEYAKAMETHAKATGDLKDVVAELSESIVAHSEQIKALQVAQQTTNSLLQSIVAHVADLNARDRMWYEAGQKRHVPDAPA